MHSAVRLSLALTICLPAAVHAQEAGQATHITTDTAAYCIQLADQLVTQQGVTDFMLKLSRDGREMCAEGHIRPGINRVRHAWVLLHRAEDGIQ